MIVNSLRRRIDGDFLESMCGLELTEENLQNLRKNILGRLKQFHLQGIYEPDDVLNEVVIRFMRTLLKEKKIFNPEAWIRITAYNIIRELSRKQKCQNLDHNTHESMVASGEDISLYLTQQEESERIHDALKKLSPETQYLLELRFFKGFSWQEIAQYLTQKGQKVSVATLRKRGERAINQLREVYFKNFL